MNEQYEKSLTKLELDKVLAMLSDHAASQAAKDRCLAVRPSTDADEIRHLLDETSAACACPRVLPRFRRSSCRLRRTSRA